MAADTELPLMAVDSEGLETGENRRLMMQELHMIRALLQHLNNPDPEPEKQATLMKKHQEDLHDFHCKAEAKRKKTQGHSLKGEKKGVTAQGRQVPFRTLSWNLAGLAEDTLEPFLACARVTMLWDVMLRQEPFRKRRARDGGVHHFYSWNSLGNDTGVGGVQPSLCRNESATSVIVWRAVIVGWQFKCRLRNEC